MLLSSKGFHWLSLTLLLGCHYLIINLLVYSVSTSPSVPQSQLSRQLVKDAHS